MVKPFAQGRGAIQNPPGRFEVLELEPDPELQGVEPDEERLRGVPTRYLRDTSKTIISSNTSPD